MKLPYRMLLDFVETKLDASQTGDLLTMAGFELEELETVEGEPVLNVKVMSNRGDGLSAFGLAREVLAKEPHATPTILYERASARFAEAGAPPEGGEGLVTIETPDCCRYACLLFAGVANGDAPDWIKKRLRQAGMRPISLLVDLSNYVMLELGQPMHAFDLAKLEGGRIVVRGARKGEKLTTLDGVERELAPGQMMICDARRLVAAAGIMGGLDTEVSARTSQVLLESAHFDAGSVRRTRKQLGLSTEASYRFERSVDPEGVVAALNRFAQLLSESGSPASSSGLVDVYPGRHDPLSIELSLSQANRLLGMDIEPAQAKSYLENLGFQVSGDGEPLIETPPSWRPDVVRECDVIEELGRVHGYEKIPECLPHGATLQGGVFGLEARVDQVRDCIVRLGFSQLMSHSLRDLHPLDSGGTRVGPRHPSSPEMAYLRNSLLPCLADAAVRNEGSDLHLFEVGRVIAGGGDGPVEHRNVALLSVGALCPPNRQHEVAPQADFFSLKGALLEVAMTIGAALKLESPSTTDPRLHPTRQAMLSCCGKPIGVLGQIHPAIAETISLPESTVMAELDIDALCNAASDSATYRPISRNPAVRRDIAILIAKALPYEKVEKSIVAACGELLERHWLFDVYDGKGIPAGMHSLGLALQLRKFGGNLTDEEANQVREKAVAALAALGATPR